MKRRRSLYARPEIIRGQQCAGARLHAERCCAAGQSQRRQVSSPRSRHRLPSAADAATRARLRRQPAAAAVVAVQDVRTPATPSVALFASSVRHADRRPSNGSGGRPMSTASSVHATGVMRMSGQTGVWCPRPLQPCCPHRAGSRNAPVPRDWPRWAHRVRRVAVVGERLGRRCPNRACREGWSCVGQCVAGTSGDGRPGPPLRTGKGGGAALTAWATKGAGAALGAGRVAGGHGKEQVRTRRSAGASRTGCRRGARHGPDREVVTTVSGRCAGVGPVSSGSGGPIRFGGEQPAAAARPRYVRRAVRSALTAR
jgi:hypothetical protein